MTVMGTTTALMSFAEFERVDQGADHIELLRGELIRVPPPQRPHIETSEELYDILKAAVELVRKTQPGVKLGKVHIEMGYLLTGDPRSWLQPA
jgi:Uma2 family endonuclease